MFLPVSVCLFVCPSVFCPLDSSKSYKWIFNEFFGGVERIDFGGDADHGPYPQFLVCKGSFIPIPIPIPIPIGVGSLRRPKA